MFNEGVLRNEGASDLKLKLKIIHSKKPLRYSILAPLDNTSHARTLGVSAIISVTHISIIIIQSVIMPTKSREEVKLTPKPLPAKACREKLKFIMFVLLMNSAFQMSRELGGTLERSFLASR